MIALALPLMMLRQPVAAHPNLAPNPGFEVAAEGGVPAAWHAWGGSPTPAAAQRDASRPHSGSSCLRVTNDSAGHNYYAASDYLPAEPGRQYLLAVWARAAAPNSARIRLDMLDASRGYLGAESAIVQVGVHWRHVGLIARQLRQGAAWLQISLEAGVGGPGSVWYDDVALTAIDAPLDPLVSGPDPATWKPFPIPWRDTGATATDVSFLLDAPTGRHGFLTATPDGHFHFQDGKRARFWGTNVHASNAAFPTHGEAQSFAARLSRQGVNMVRIHLLEYDAPGGLIDPAYPDSQHLMPAQLEKLDYLLFQFHLRGIYVIVDALPMCARTFRPGDGVNREIAKLGLGAEIASYFDPKVMDLERKYASDLFAHWNPYTRKRYRDDPTIALVEMTNENTLFLLGYWWPELPPYYRQELQALWNAWLAKRYPARPTLDASWRDAERRGILGPGEDAAAGSVLAPARPDPGEFGERGADWARFLSDLQRKYHSDMHAFLRSIGIEAPITASNIVSHPLGQASYDVLDFTDQHVYWDAPEYENGTESSLSNRPLVRANPTEEPTLVRGLSTVKMAGKPCILTEWNATWPNQFRAADVLATTAYACLQDWDAIFIYSYRGGWGQRYGQWDDSIPHGTVLFADPAEAGLFPACAAMFLRHDVSVARHTVEVAYTADDAARRPFPHVDPHAFVPYMSRIQRRFAGETGKGVAAVIPAGSAVPGIHSASSAAPRLFALPLAGQCSDVAAQFDRRMTAWRLYNGPAHWTADSARSDTGELRTNWRNGTSIIDTARTQSVAGFLGRSAAPFRLKHLAVTCRTPFATLTLSSLDGKPVATSSHLLLTAVGRAENSGQKLETPSLPPEAIGVVDPAAGGSVKVANLGAAPVLIEPIQADVTVLRSANARRLRVFALDKAGRRTSEVPARALGDRIAFAIGGKWATIYYELDARR